MFGHRSILAKQKGFFGRFRWNASGSGMAD
jgi:hypothetical protein